MFASVTKSLRDSTIFLNTTTWVMVASNIIIVYKINSRRALNIFNNNLIYNNMEHKVNVEQISCEKECQDHDEHQNITTFRLGDENHPVNDDDEVNIF
jgi:hypothetical protein